MRKWLSVRAGSWSVNVAPCFTLCDGEERIINGQQKSWNNWYINKAVAHGAMHSAHLYDASACLKLLYEKIGMCLYSCTVICHASIKYCSSLAWVSLPTEHDKTGNSSLEPATVSTILFCKPVCTKVMYGITHFGNSGIIRKSGKPWEYLGLLSHLSRRVQSPGCGFCIWTKCGKVLNLCVLKCWSPLIEVLPSCPQHVLLIYLISVLLYLI